MTKTDTKAKRAAKEHSSPVSCSDPYDEYLAKWKKRVGYQEPQEETEESMVEDDAKRSGTDYCISCMERFKISEMRLITRTDDPYVQYDSEGPKGKPSWWIPIQHRVRKCKPCHEEDDES